MGIMFENLKDRIINMLMRNKRVNKYYVDFLLNKIDEADLKKVYQYLTSRGFFIEGVFRAWIEEKGTIIQKHEQHNTIVIGARKLLAHLISEGCTNAFNRLNLFKIGGRPLSMNNITELPPDFLSTPEILQPVEPSIVDVKMVYGEGPGINDYTASIALGDLDTLAQPKFTFSFPDSPNETSVLFSFHYDRPDGVQINYNPTPYSSSGLYYFDSVGNTTTLFASKTFPLMVKTYTRKFFFEWQIKF